MRDLAAASPSDPIDPQAIREQNLRRGRAGSVFDITTVAQ